MRLYNKSELKDSRIFFDKKPPYFLTIFIIFTLCLLVVSIWVSSLLSKSYIVEAQGTITSKDNTYIGALSDGILVEMKKPEGSLVNEGDVLFTVSNGSEGVQYQSLNTQIVQAKEKIGIIDNYIKSLENNTNYLKNRGLQQEYYAKVEYYLSIVKEENKTTESTKKTVLEKQEKIKTKQNEITSLKDQIHKLTESEEDVLKKEELQSKLETKQSELETLQTEVEQSSQSGSSQAYQTKLQLVSEAGTARTTLETSVLELQGQIDAYQKQDSLYEVKANHTGYIHYLTPLKEGMAIQKTQTIGEISENKEELLYVEAYINATDRPKVEINDTVKVSLNGVNTQKYGTLQGTVENINMGTITQESNNGNLLLYRCTIVIDSKELKDSKGHIIKTSKSMPVVARIVYEKETYLDWVLDMLSFTN